MMEGALGKIAVLDFTTLLPGPLASLLMSAAGAEVIKVEKPGRGDEMRDYEPRLGTTSVNFALLNSGKKSLVLDLKSAGGRAEAQAMAAEADILIEQFRPGVMDRLGLGYDELKAINPGIIYCSITGYGQDGARAGDAGHDLNYAADAGMLALSDPPAVPPVLVADIGGGAYPAVINILLALLERARTGLGRHLDIAMADNLFTWMYWALGNGLGADRWPTPGGELVTGGSPRYRVYATADGRHLAVAPLEDRFWDAFCDAVDLPDGLRDDQLDPRATITAVADLIAARTAAEWEAIFGEVDACCTIVRGIDEAVGDPRFIERGLFEERSGDGSGSTIPALPLPIDRGLRRHYGVAEAPPLGQGVA